jgi:hypothetical protein
MGSIATDSLATPDAPLWSLALAFPANIAADKQTLKTDPEM